ncbi:tetratricopeptide repeat protein [Pyxidicoccus caerfyrddinensis]|uniref:tetratricopeptide repeat protein n=1 Tax=Pyxidicoccus caerfyrddinensis TaxID=2709663 RepID=UPI0019678B3B|nr:tetratricopeptide repeat protein [Pyxidicoccus caerfyrddinensis]
MARCSVSRTGCRGFVLSVLLVLTGLACVKRPVDYEREYAKQLAPKKLEVSSASSSSPVRKLRVRVYVDSDYRDQVLHWRSSIVSQLQRASAVVRGPLGVTFELESTHPWERRSSESTLDTTLSELEALDPGEDVDLVIGLVSHLKGFTASQHHLGMARMFGRHCVLREMGNAEEVAYIMRTLTHLPADERDSLSRELKLHKETSVLLHEWAHTLGAFHVQNSHWMMYPEYGKNQAAFAPQMMELLAVSLRHLPQARREAEAQRAWARELKEKLATIQWSDWDGPEKDQAVAWLDGIASGRTTLERGPEPLPPVDRQRIEEVLSLDKQGRFEVAAQQLEPVARRHPDHEDVQALACYVATRAAPGLPATRERCEAAAARFPRHPGPLISLASLRLREGKRAEAQSYLVQVRQRAEARQETNPDQWAELAVLFKETGSVTWAEQVAAKAAGVKEMDKVLTWATQMRRWVALLPDPEKSGVPVEREGDLIRAAKEVEAQLDKGTATKAEAKLQWLTREFPRAVVVDVLRCEVHLRAGRMGPARAACRKALAADDEAVNAHFILGWLAVNAGSRQEARTHLERVIALEPLHADAWRMLAEQYRAAGMHDALKELKGRYRTQFARELPVG